MDIKNIRSYLWDFNLQEYFQTIDRTKHFHLSHRTIENWIYTLRVAVSAMAHICPNWCWSAWWNHLFHCIDQRHFQIVSYGESRNRSLEDIAQETYSRWCCSTQYCRFWWMSQTFQPMFSFHRVHWFFLRQLTFLWSLHKWYKQILAYMFSLCNIEKLQFFLTMNILLHEFGIFFCIHEMECSWEMRWKIEKLELLLVISCLTTELLFG